MVDLRTHPVDREISGGPVVLTLSHQSPLPPAAGNEYRLWDMIEALRSAGYRCIPLVCPLEPQEAKTALSSLLDDGREFVLCHRDGSIDAAVGGVKLTGKGLAATSDDRRWEERRRSSLGPALRQHESHYTTPPMRAALQALGDALDLHAVVANYVFSAGLLELVPKGALRLIDTHDVFSRQVLPDGPGPDGRTTTLTAEEEAQLLRSGDVLIAIQDVEAAVLASLAPSAHVVTCGVSFPYVPLEIGSAAQHRVVMLGSGNPLNVAGLNGFLRTVWPGVLRCVPDAELVVAGRLSDSVPPWAPQVMRLGMVADVADAYREGSVVVNPAFMGTGLKVKTVEALSNGRRVVCFPAGSEGLRGVDLPQLLTVEDAEEMRAALVRLLLGAPEIAPYTPAFSRDTVYGDLLGVLQRSA